MQAKLLRFSHYIFQLRRKVEVDPNSRNAKRYETQNKNKSMLDGLIFKYGTKKTMSTIEKSEIDWEKDKKDKKDSDELREHRNSQRSFVSRAKFLSRSDYKEQEAVRNEKLGKKRGRDS